MEAGSPAETVYESVSVSLPPGVLPLVAWQGPTWDVPSERTTVQR